MVSVARGQDFQRGSYLSFEYPAGRFVGTGFTLRYSQPLEPKPLFTALSAAQRLSKPPTFPIAFIAEASLNIDEHHYRVFFPSLPTRDTLYVFAVAPIMSPTQRTYFQIPRERYSDFEAAFRGFLDETCVQRSILSRR